ncbi:MAG: hypothetical protein ACPHRO_15930, partial [Nannocystaceae bacterium]
MSGAAGGVSPPFEFGMFGSAAHRDRLDLRAWPTARFWEAENSPEMARQYRAANRLRFPGPLALPGWVFSDLFVLPGAIGVITGPAALLEEEMREALQVDLSERAIMAAYYAAPTLTQGLFVGVSLISLLPGRGLGRVVKGMALHALGAEMQRGVAQWSNWSLRSHAKIGPMRIVGGVPSGHALEEESFVYEIDLQREGTSPGANMLVPVDDLETLQGLLRPTPGAAEVFVVSPGFDGTHV